MVPFSSSGPLPPHFVCWFEETYRCNQILLVFLSAPDILQTTVPSWLVGRTCFVSLSPVFPQHLLRNPVSYNLYVLQLCEFLISFIRQIAIIYFSPLLDYIGKMGFL